MKIIAMLAMLAIYSNPSCETNNSTGSSNGHRQRPCTISSVNGRVFDDSTGLPIDSAFVCCAETFCDFSDSSANGLYYISRVPEGRRLIVAEHSDYYPDSVRMTFRECMVYGQVDFHLKRQ